MGDRADFYIGRGKNAEYAGSIAWNGYPEEISEAVLSATSEEEFVSALKIFFEGRDDVTSPDQGWPWPWNDSTQTDYAYAFDEGKVWTSCFGCAWFDPNTVSEEECEITNKTAQFPDMVHNKNVTFDKRSGLIFDDSHGEEVMDKQHEQLDVYGNIEKTFISHLEFLGYSSEKMISDQDERIVIFKCTHPVKPDLFLMPIYGFDNIVISTQAPLDTDFVEKNRSGLLELINHMNYADMLVYAFINADNSLFIKTITGTHYNKVTFGVVINFFIEAANTIIQSVMSLNEEEETQEYIGTEEDDAEHDYYGDSIDEDAYESYGTDCDSCPAACGDSPDSCENCSERFHHPSGNWDD